MTNGTHHCGLVNPRHDRNWSKKLQSFPLSNRKNKPNPIKTFPDDDTFLKYKILLVGILTVLCSVVHGLLQSRDF